MMGGLGRILGGALEGIGQGMHDQAMVNIERDREDALMRREIALKNLGYQQDVAMEGVRQANRLDLTDRETGNKIIATRDELGQRGQLAAADDARTEAA